MYEIVILPGAEKEIRKLPNDVADTILAAIELLTRNPKPNGSKQMNNYSTPRFKVKTFHRIKVKTTYHVIYHIENNQFVVTIVKAAHRGKVYKS